MLFIEITKKETHIIPEENTDIITNKNIDMIMDHKDTTPLIERSISDVDRLENTDTIQKIISRLVVLEGNHSRF